MRSMKSTYIYLVGVGVAVEAVMMVGRREVSSTTGQWHRTPRRRWGEKALARTPGWR